MRITDTDDRELELGLGDDRFVSYDQLKPLGIPYSRQHLTVLEDQGQFPRRYRLSARTVGWKFSELRTWMATRGRR
jgi:predicted DNA-binding transcriptional regulator AlpA